MLTLKSKFADYIGILKAAGACEEVMSFHDKMLAEKPDLTVGDVYKVFQADTTFEDGWCMWALQLIGKELGEDVRAIIIEKIKDPMACLQLLTPEAGCDFLTSAEHTLLKAKYTGKLPVAEKEILDGKVKLQKVKHGRD